MSDKASEVTTDDAVPYSHFLVDLSQGSRGDAKVKYMCCRIVCRTVDSLVSDELPTYSRDGDLCAHLLLYHLSNILDFALARRFGSASIYRELQTFSTLFSFMAFLAFDMHR